jgi:hypothetical protein
VSERGVADFPEDRPGFNDKVLNVAASSAVSPEDVRPDCLDRLRDNDRLNLCILEGAITNRADLRPGFEDHDVDRRLVEAELGDALERRGNDELLERAASKGAFVDECEFRIWLEREGLERLRLVTGSGEGFLADGLD